MQEIHRNLQIRGMRVDPTSFEFELSIYRATLRECKLVQGEWEAQLELRGPAGRIFWGRVVFSSLSKRKEIAREFRIRTRDKAYDIERALETILIHAQVALTSIYSWDWRPGVSAQQRYLVHPILPDKVVSVLAGDGGGGKGYFSLLLSCLVSTGVSAAGFYPATRASVVYLDYESTQEDFAQRVERIANGHGLQKDQIRIRYLRADAPYSMLHNSVHREVRETGAGLLIVDSLAPAIGPFTEGAASSIDVMRKFRELDCAVLCIAHVAKAQLGSKEQTPYGSVFIKNLARNVWVLVRGSQADNVSEIAVKHIKSNIAALSPTILMRINFYNEAVRFEPIPRSQRAEYGEHLSLAERVMLALDEPRTASDIARMLEDVSPARVSQVLSALEKAGKVVVTHGSGRRGDPKRYALVYRADGGQQEPTQEQDGQDGQDDGDPFA